MPYNIGVSNLSRTWCSTWQWSNLPVTQSDPPHCLSYNKPTLSKCVQILICQLLQDTKWPIREFWFHPRFVLVLCSRHVNLLNCPSPPSGNVCELIPYSLNWAQSTNKMNITEFRHLNQRFDINVHPPHNNSHKSFEILQKNPSPILCLSMSHGIQVRKHRTRIHNISKPKTQQFMHNSYKKTTLHMLCEANRKWRVIHEILKWDQEIIFR